MTQSDLFGMDNRKEASAQTILKEYTIPHFRAKDPISALTHFIGFLAAILAMPVLLVHAAQYGRSEGDLISLSIFMLSMVFLYGASASYHTFQLSDRANKGLKKIDHSMIFILIAGSYTPVCTMVLPETTGKRILFTVWGIALIGIIFKLCWVTCPKWVSSVIYIGMGWVCILAFGEIYRGMPTTSFLWLLIGGIIYTVGGVIYALKLPLLEKYFEGFGAHELFHLFVMGGSFCHFLAIYSFLK
ncbi:MAG: hemolysin III family protein [Blautia sp.]|nr:hemolysin III family protein [Blautia sp.]